MGFGFGSERGVFDRSAIVGGGLLYCGSEEWGAISEVK